MEILAEERIVELENKLVTKVRHCDVTNRIAQLESERDKLREALLAAKGSLPNDANYNDPWSLCIAIIDDALEVTK